MKVRNVFITITSVILLAFLVKTSIHVLNLNVKEIISKTHLVMLSGYGLLLLEQEACSLQHQLTICG